MVNRFQKDTLSIGVNNIAVNILGLFTAIVIARSLGPVNQGLLALAITIADVLNRFISLGTRSSVLYFINSKQYTAAEVYDTVVSSSVLLSVILGIGTIIFYRPNLTEISFHGISGSVYIPVFIGSYLVLNFLRANVLGIFYALEEFKIANNINLVYFGLPSVFLAMLWILGMVSLPMVLISYIVNSIINLLLVFTYSYKLKLHWRPKIDRLLFVKMLSFGLPVYYNGLVQIIQQRAGVFFITQFLGLAQVGYFMVAYSVADKLSELSKPLLVTHFPKVTQYQTESPKLALEFTKKIVSKLLAIFIMFEVPFLIIAPLFIPIFFSSQYDQSIVPALILSVSAVIWGLIGIINNFFAACYLQMNNSIILTIGLLANIAGLAIVYIFKGGIISVSISISVSCLVIFIIQLFYMKNKFNADLGKVRPDFRGVIEIASDYIKVKQYDKKD